MSVLDKIRNKPHAEKVRLIWIICIITGVILVVVWIFTSKINKNMPKDTRLFQSAKESIKNLK
ncbi:MAG: hypothetical protein AAB410_02270 [Patescibacteria group bacterium]